jgi:hypothetical protein
MIKFWGIVFPAVNNAPKIPPLRTLDIYHFDDHINFLTKTIGKALTVKDGQVCPTTLVFFMVSPCLPGLATRRVCFESDSRPAMQ